MPNEPRWLSPQGLVRVNAKLLEQTGEPHALRDLALLESGCARPQNLWAYGERDVAVLATALAFGVARNHPFVQGNKRTAFAAMVGFLGANGFALTLSDDVSCADHMLAVLTGERTEESFAETLREVIEPVTNWA